ncbi:hypothetical protein [Streptomyces sp. NPDC059866]
MKPHQLNADVSRLFIYQKGLLHDRVIPIEFETVMTAPALQVA